MLYFDFKFMQHLLSPESLAKANKRTDDLAIKLDQSEKAHKKAEQDAASLEDLWKRLHHAENALSKKTTQQIAREEAIIGRLESQNRRFVSEFFDHFSRASFRIGPPHMS